MTSAFRQISIIIFTAFLFNYTHAQEPATNFLDQIKNYDLSKILTADTILAEDNEGGKDKIERAEILGFISNDFQRLYIHFISVIQNPTNPYEYLVFGKTKVKENICSFQGTITIKQSKVYKSDELPTYKQGFASCDVILFEDKNQSSTGFFKGTLTSNFVIDKEGNFRYDAVMFFGDGFSNNQFVGNWTSYKSNVSKICNWGDYRIPECDDLDIGAGEFSVNEKYVKNGWASYESEIMIPNKAILKPAVESKKWWE